METGSSERRIGCFRLIAPDGSVGFGGQGTLFRAVCERADFPGLAVGTEVVLKILPARDAADDRWPRLAECVAALVRLDSPHVVRHYGFFREPAETGEHPVIVMELLAGETLKARLARAPGGLDADEVLNAMRAVAAGLAAAASVGIVHRDVKPDNVFLCRDGSVKLIDFGIARLTDWPDVPGKTPPVGSFDYLAPERVDAAFRGDFCADVFSLGVTLYEALVGRLPYAVGADARPEYAFYERWGREAVGNALAIDGRIGRIVPGLPEILRRALAIDRAERFQDFPSLVTALQTLEPAVIRSESEGYRVLGILGTGGFGEVLRTRRLRDGKAVALKHLRRLDDEAARRFRAEARAMAALNDTAFVRFHEYFETEANAVPQAYLAMDCLAGMPGRSLRDALAAAGGAGLPTGAVLAAFVRYAHGLAVLHAHGLVHRDIKPSNLYFPAEDPAHAVIMDLGVALDWNVTLSDGSVPGTPDYMAPEVIARASRGSAAADVYALGLCLYEALTGHPVFPRFRNGMREAHEAFVVRARQMRAPRLDAPLVAANPSLARLLRQMTEPDVVRRLSSAAEAEIELMDLDASFRQGEWNVPAPAEGEASASDPETPPDDATRTADTPTAEVLTAEARDGGSADESFWRRRIVTVVVYVASVVFASVASSLVTAILMRQAIAPVSGQAAVVRVGKGRGLHPQDRKDPRAGSDRIRVKEGDSPDGKR